MCTQPWSFPWLSLWMVARMLATRTNVELWGAKVLLELCGEVVGVIFLWVSVKSLWNEWVVDDQDCPKILSGSWVFGQLLISDSWVETRWPLGKMFYVFIYLFVFSLLFIYLYFFLSKLSAQCGAWTCDLEIRSQMPHWLSQPSAPKIFYFKKKKSGNSKKSASPIPVWAG